MSSEVAAETDTPVPNRDRVNALIRESEAEAERNRRFHSESHKLSRNLQLEIAHLEGGFCKKHRDLQEVCDQCDAEAWQLVLLAFSRAHWSTRYKYQVSSSKITIAELLAKSKLFDQYKTALDELMKQCQVAVPEREELAYYSGLLLTPPGRQPFKFDPVASFYPRMWRLSSGKMAPKINDVAYSSILLILGGITTPYTIMILQGDPRIPHGLIYLIAPAWLFVGHFQLCLLVRSLGEVRVHSAYNLPSPPFPSSLVGTILQTIFWAVNFCLVAWVSPISGMISLVLLVSLLASVFPPCFYEPLIFAIVAKQIKNGKISRESLEEELVEGQEEGQEPVVKIIEEEGNSLEERQEAGRVV